MQSRHNDDAVPAFNVLLVSQLEVFGRKAAKIFFRTRLPVCSAGLSLQAAIACYTRVVASVKVLGARPKIFTCIRPVR
ncbi:hypothetical protein [Chitinophaga sp. OAE865]|uniref:hypothetical protein n=1 Tax=Chitinophaga sp. OAE865 TaxID=2817898 RepID=UPI001AE1AB28